MIATDAIFGRKKTASGPGVSYIDITGLLYGYSFRQLFPEAVRCLKQYNSSGQSQDVGFVKGYVDKQSIISFAGGQLSRFEWYNQVTDVLKYTGLGTYITNSAGQLLLDNDKMYGNWNSDRLSMQSVTFATSSNILRVAYGLGIKTTYMLASKAGWFGAMNDGSTVSPTASVGAPTYWKNGVQINPATRGSLYTAYNGSMLQLTVKNVNISGWSEYQNGYSNFTAFWPQERQFEELIFDGATQTPAQLLAVEQNQIDYYL